MKNVILFTDEYPYGFGEEYLTPEIELLCKKCNLTVITLQSDKPRKKLIDVEIPIYRINRDISKVSKGKKIKYLVKCVGKKYFWNELYDIVKYKKNICNRVYDSMIYLCTAEYIYDEVKNFDFWKAADIIYTYWMTPATLAIVDNFSNTKIKLISRTHGYDLYQERRKTGWQPFRKYINQHINNIYFACEFGKKYYEKTYEGVTREKLKLARLGARKYFKTPIYKKQSKLRLYSCSSLHPLKRVKNIADALYRISDFEIEWVHIGADNYYSEVINYVKNKLKDKKNITYKFLGRMENKEVHDYLSKNVIDVMIMLSVSEGGCPVAIQEAMAYGIPIIGTNAGGITEMISNNGILLSENPSDEEVMEAIQRFFYMTTEEMEDMKKATYKKWQQLFNADNNSEKFVEELLQSE